MIQRILLVFLLVLSFSCEKEMTTYTVTGKIQDAEDGAKVKLQELVNNRPVLVSETTIKDGKFEFTGSVEEEGMRFISMDGVVGNLPFILENANIDIEVIDKTNLNRSILKGTESNVLLNEYGTRLYDASVSNDKLNQAYIAAQKANDQEKMSAIIESFDSLKNAQNDFEIAFVKKNNQSLISVLAVERMMHSRNFKTITIKELFDQLSPELQESKTGQNITKFLEPMLATMEGAKAPNFEGPTPDGKTLVLNDITSQNKVTIVDFWAAWCAPCRKENPNLVKLYEKYHDKGLEIVGVSLDGNGRQQDPKAAWMKAIEDDGLTWHQVSNLKYFEDPIAQSYSIRAIPATFVLDSEGKIIGKELRGKALEDKIGELLN